jgi:hypothetical protein
MAALVEARKWIEPSPIFEALDAVISRMPEEEKQHLQHARNSLEPSNMRSSELCESSKRTAAEDWRATVPNATCLP